MHWTSLRYSSSKNVFAFLQLVGTEWWLLPRCLPLFSMNRFISALVKSGIFAKRLPQPWFGKFTVCSELEATAELLEVVGNTKTCQAEWYCWAKLRKILPSSITLLGKFSFRVQWIWIRINNNTVLSLTDVFLNCIPAETQRSITGWLCQM